MKEREQMCGMKIVFVLKPFFVVLGRENNHELVPNLQPVIPMGAKDTVCVTKLTNLREST